MNHFERALSDNEQALTDFTTDIEYLLKITGKLHTLGKLSINSAHMMPHDKAIKEDDLMRGVRVTPEVLGIADKGEPDFIDAMNNCKSPFGEEKILYGDSDSSDQLSLFDDFDENSNGRIIRRGEKDPDED